MQETGTSPTAEHALDVGEDGLYVMRTQQDVMRVARGMIKSGVVPSTLRTPEQVAMAVQSLKSLGLNPYVSIRQCGFVKGAFMIHTDLPLAVVRSSNLLVGFEEFVFTMGEDQTYKRVCFANSNCHLEPFGAVCRVRRSAPTGEASAHEVVFTREQAERAGLWNSTPPWRQYPGRMLTLRARGQALKDMFSDVLSGVGIGEYEETADPKPPPGPERCTRTVDLEEVLGEGESPASGEGAPTESRVTALTARLRGQRYAQGPKGATGRQV